MSKAGKPSGQWLYILLLLGVLHILVDARYRIVSLFPSRDFGFGVLGVAYLIMAVLLIMPVQALRRFLGPLDDWVRLKFCRLTVGRVWSHRVVIGSVVALMVAAGCGLRWLVIKQLAIEPRFADMLPLIQGACDALVKGGDPYGRVYAMPWPLPLTFWPGLWMPYLVPHLLSVDIRWVHIGVVVGISLVFIRFFSGVGSGKTRQESAVMLAAISGLFLFLFSSEPVLFANIAHTPPQWLWISLLAGAILLKRPWLSAVCLGLVLSSRQTAVVFCPLMVIYWLRTSGSFRVVAKLVGVTMVTFLIICGPFLILNPHAFVVAPLQHYAALGAWDFSRGPASFAANTIGLSYMIRSTKVDWLLPAIALVAIIGPWVLAWRRLRSATDVLLYMGFSGMVVALTSPIPWHYEYFPVFILISFAAIASAAEDDAIRNTDGGTGGPSCGSGRVGE